MKAWIRERLGQIADLYPRERLERSKARLRAEWNGSVNPAFPFYYGPIRHTYYGPLLTPEETLRRYLDEFAWRGRIDDDFIPALFNGCHQGLLPNLFGAEEVILGHDYSSRRLIADPSDIDRLPEPAIRPGSLADQCLAMQRYFLEETEGALPVHVTDMQSPVETAAKLWCYEELFMAALSEPEVYHNLLARCEAAFQLLWDAQRNLLGDRFLATHLCAWDWIPEDFGVTLSIDSLVMVSPSFFDEHYRPGIERLAEHNGGVTVHSCGDFSAVLPALTALPRLRGVHCGQMKPSRIAEVLRDWPRPFLGNIGPDEAEREWRCAREAGLRTVLSIGGFWPDDRPETWDAATWKRLRERHEQLRTLARR